MEILRDFFERFGGRFGSPVFVLLNQPHIDFERLSKVFLRLVLRRPQFFDFVHYIHLLPPASYHTGEGKSKGGISTKGLAYMRKRAKLKQFELADLLKVERSTIAKWESGAAYPRAAQLPELAAALHCTIDELYQPPEESA